MEPIAVEIVRNRRRPSHPELMQATCPILGLVSAWYPSSVHGYSTTLMASMFTFEYLFANLPLEQLRNMVSYMYTGVPVHRSAYDGLGGPRIMPFAAPQVPLVSTRDLELYIEGVIGAGVDIIREPAKPAAVQDGCEEGDEITGFETLDSKDLDVLISDLDAYADSPFATTCQIQALDAESCKSGESDDDECGATSVSLVTPVDGAGSKRMLSPTPPPHDQKHNSIDKKRRSFSAQEDECIMVYYEKHGAKWRDMARTLAAETLSSRSEDALRNRHYRLTAHRDESSSTTSTQSSSSTSTASKPLQRRVSWTIAEDELILIMASKFEDRSLWKRIAKFLPGRTTHAIRNRANRLFLERERKQIVNALPLVESG